MRRARFCQQRVPSGIIRNGRPGGGAPGYKDSRLRRGSFIRSLDTTCMDDGTNSTSCDLSKRTISLRRRRGMNFVASPHRQTRAGSRNFCCCISNNIGRSRLELATTLGRNQQHAQASGTLCQRSNGINPGFGLVGMEGGKLGPDICLTPRLSSP